MRLKTIKKLVKLVEESDIGFLEVSSFFYSVRIRKSFYRSQQGLFEEEDYFGDHTGFSMVEELRNP